jgi:RNA polymerase sigma-70 factor (ECF subfamily)
MASDLTSLLIRAGAGDVEAFDEFVRQSQHDLQRFVRSLVGIDAAADLAQETLLRAWRSSSTFTGSSNGKTWLFGVARNVIADHQRRHARRNRIRRFVTFSAVGANQTENLSPRLFETAPLDAADRARFDEHRALSELVDQLEPQRREAFVLSQIVGFSYAEVAEICGVPIGTVRSRVARARESLAAAYQLAEMAEHEEHSGTTNTGLGSRTARREAR